jgi:glycosyltransferase involved in cell wall biosynthesis
MQKHMIFHHPFPLPTTHISGSMVRILNMYNAFMHLGYKVHLVTGFANDRKKALDCIKDMVRGGCKIDFVYSESSTIPNLLSKRNYSLPFLEIHIFKWCQDNAIPIGLFYRDIHWRFDHYKAVTRSGRKVLAKYLYWYDWLNYVRFVDYLFLPSVEMAPFLPTRWDRDRLQALPPGCHIHEWNSDITSYKASGETLSLLYVGGVRPPLYNLTPMFESITCSKVASLTLCCRFTEWNDVKEFYKYLPNDTIKIIHVDSPSLAPYYFQSDAFLLGWKPYSYLSFAMPVKVFEAIGYGLPLIALSGTLAASFISNENLGWVVANTDELVALYAHLAGNPDEVFEKQKNVERIRQQHTWEVRAKRVADILTKENLTL